MPEYWVSKPHLLISKIKVCVDGIINDGFQNGGGRVSIKKIYDVLKAAPYGFMPCNLSALGALLFGQNALQIICSISVSESKVSDKDKYIVAMTPAEKAFNEITSVAFGIPLNMCTSVPNTRERIRCKSFAAFPLVRARFPIAMAISLSVVPAPMLLLLAIPQIYSGLCA